MHYELTFNWDAQSFFKRLTEANKFAQENGFVFHPVSGLEGFHGALTNLLRTKAFVCVSDTSDGNMELENTSRTSRIKTVFMAYRHKAFDETQRNIAMAKMRELFRQFMSVLIQEKIHIEEDDIYLDPRIAFKEIDQYFYTDAACALFQIKVDTFTNLEYNENEWITQPLTQ